MSGLVLTIVWAVGCYAVGMVSFGDIVARSAGVDIRTRGTKNPGAANIYRELGPKYGGAVFALDVAKGALATAPLLLFDVHPAAIVIAAVAVVLGHMFPVLSKRPGGTGMASAMGTTVGLAPIGLIGGVPAAILMLALTRNSGYTGGVLFAVTALIAGIWSLITGIWSDLLLGAGVLIVAAIVLLKARIQYGVQSASE